MIRTRIKEFSFNFFFASQILHNIFFSQFTSRLLDFTFYAKQSDESKAGTLTN